MKCSKWKRAGNVLKAAVLIALTGISVPVSAKEQTGVTQPAESLMEETDSGEPESVEKQESSILFSGGSLDKIYDGRPAVEPQVSVTGSSGKVSFFWEEKGAEGWATLAGTPVEAGTYRVTASVEEDENFAGARTEQEFVIKKADRHLSISADGLNKVYDGKPAEIPQLKGEGDVESAVFEWFRKEADTWNPIAERPYQAGTYKVTARTGEERNWKEGFCEAEFEIEKAQSSLSFEEGELGKVYDRTPVRKPQLHQTGSMREAELTWYRKEGAGWKTLLSAPSEPGEYRVIARVEEDENYSGATAEKSFQILPPETVQEEEDGGAVTEQEKVPDESEKEPGIREEQEEEAAAVGTESADTGDSMPVAGWLLLGTIAGIAAVMMKIRQNRAT